MRPIGTTVSATSTLQLRRRVGNTIHVMMGPRRYGHWSSCALLTDQLCTGSSQHSNYQHSAMSSSRDSIVRSEALLSRHAQMRRTAYTIVVLRSTRDRDGYRDGPCRLEVTL